MSYKRLRTCIISPYIEGGHVSGKRWIPILAIILMATAISAGAGQSFTPLKELNTVMKHDAPGVLGMTGQNQFYLTLKPRPDLELKNPVIGKVIAGSSVLEKLTRDDAIRSIRIVRVGKTATDFKTDTVSFQNLVQEKAKTLAPVKAPVKKKQLLAP